MKNSLTAIGTQPAFLLSIRGCASGIQPRQNDWRLEYFG